MMSQGPGVNVVVIVNAAGTGENIATPLVSVLLDDGFRKECQYTLTNALYQPIKPIIYITVTMDRKYTHASGNRHGTGEYDVLWNDDLVIGICDSSLIPVLQNITGGSSSSNSKSRHDDGPDDRTVVDDD